MARKILMNVADGDECRIAVIEDGRLYEYFVDRPSQLKHVGNIYKALIQNVEPGIQAAFVDIGLERNGFLHVSDVLYAYENSPKLTDLFPHTLRIREQMPEEAMPAQHSEREVEEVSEFVGDGRTTPAPAETHPGGEHAPTNGNGESPPREAEFLDKMSETQSGHRITDSPLEVAPPRPEPLPENALPQTAAPDLRHDDDDDDDDDTDRPAEPQVPGQPVQLGPDGQPLRKRRRRGRRGGRRRREAREAALRRASEGQGQSGTAPAQMYEPHPPDQPAPEPAPSQPAAEPAPADASTPTPPQTPAELPASSEPEKSKTRRQRLPKKRGGHLPKRLFERQGDNVAPQSAGESQQPPGGEPDSGASDESRPGGDGGPPPDGPALRFHRGPLPKIQNLLKRGQEVVVQVSKASQGGKGPGLTSMISLPGRYMVLTPNSQRGGVSRKIEDGGVRNELRKILDRLPVPEGMGVIIRTAAIDRSYDDLYRDLTYLLRLWSVITSRIADAPAPALLYSDSDPAIRAVRDYFTAETSEIVIDDRGVYERVLGFFDQLMPSFKDRVKLYDGEVPLFFADGIEGQIDHIFDKKVPLKSGGYLYVEQTEALVSIDINSGKFTSAGDAEKTAYLTNMEAIPEICRQLRLRDLGGIVCNDFIDMMNARHREDVENAMRRELRRDRARTKVARMSPFGVIEMTRQRVRPSIRSYTYVGCPTCNGFGMVHSAETMCLSLLRRMKLALCEGRVQELIVQVHPHVLSHLHSEFREDIDQLEEEFDKSILFEYARDLSLGQSRFFYLNDREQRVVYDMDQRINAFVRNEADKSHTNVALPVPVSGAAGVTFAGGERQDNKRRRRGGRRQRERDQERVQRSQRIEQESQKAVSFGATLPELPPMEVIREPARPSAHAPGRGGSSGQESRHGGAHRDRDRGRRGRRGRGSGRPRPDRMGGPPAAEGATQGSAPAPSSPPLAPTPTVQPPTASPAPAPQASTPASGPVPARRGRRPGGDKPARKPAAKAAAPKKPARPRPPAARKPAARRVPKKKAD